MSPACLQGLQAPYQGDLHAPSCLQMQAEEELTSAQSIWRACLHWLAKHCVAPLQTSRLILLSALLPIQSVSQVTNACQCLCFLDDRGEALEKGWVFGKGWTSALRLTPYPGCLKLKHIKSPVISEGKPSWWGWVKAARLHVLQKRKQGKGQCVGFDPGILAAPLKWARVGSSLTGTHRHVSWSMCQCSEESGCTTDPSGTEHRGSSAPGYCFCKHKLFSFWNACWFSAQCLPTESPGFGFQVSSPCQGIQ